MKRAPLGAPIKSVQTLCHEGIENAKFKIQN